MPFSYARRTLELGIRYYDNSGFSSSTLGSEKGLLVGFGEKSQATNYRAAMRGDSQRNNGHGLVFATKAPKSPGTPTRRRQMTRLRRMECRYSFWKHLFANFNVLEGVHALVYRYHPFRSYSDQLRFNAR